VSATLSVGNSFEFWKRRVGLSNSAARSECIAFQSPFPFERNAMLAAVDDAPPPDSPEWQAWINEAIYRLVEASGGRALVLFTSYTALRAAWDSVKPRLDTLGITAFRQGDDERSRLFDAFKTDVASVLFATDSFWEGIDAPGETLELVIITKLPFRVPTDPVQKGTGGGCRATWRQSVHGPVAAGGGHTVQTGLWSADTPFRGQGGRGRARRQAPRKALWHDLCRFPAPDKDMLQAALCLGG